MKSKVPPLEDMVLIIIRTLLDNPNMVGGICEKGGESDFPIDGGYRA